MTEPERLLSLLQFGDSQFPSGSFAFSWGLETLDADGLLPQRTDIREFVAAQLQGRWAGCERLFLSAAHRCSGAIDSIKVIDQRCHAITLGADMRHSSQRAGRSLLAIHSSLETPGADAYRERVLSDDSYGHATVVQGFIFQACGFNESEALTLAAYGFASGLLSAAVRLGRIGHRDQQATLSTLRPLIAELITHPVEPVEDAWTATPLCDIALLRHDHQTMRLFAN